MATTLERTVGLHSAIVKALREYKKGRAAFLAQLVGRDTAEVRAVLRELEEGSIVVRNGDEYSLSDR